MLKKYDSLLDLDKTISKSLFERVDNPWEVLPLIKAYILELIPSLSSDYIKYSENVYIHKSAVVSSSAYIEGPTITCEGANIRHSAYIRGCAIIGKNSVVGNSTEVKNSILFDNVECPHYNYVGDSVLGYHAHTGAGVILSNFKSGGSNVKVRDKEDVIETGLRKFGSILGSYVDVGCNSVLFPGTIVGSNTVIYPLTRVRGVIEENKIVKDIDNIVEKEV